MFCCVCCVFAIISTDHVNNQITHYDMNPCGKVGGSAICMRALFRAWAWGTRLLAWLAKFAPPYLCYIGLVSAVSEHSHTQFMRIEICNKVYIMVRATSRIKGHHCCDDL